MTWLTRPPPFQPPLSTSSDLLIYECLDGNLTPVICKEEDSGALSLSHLEDYFALNKNDKFLVQKDT